MSTTIPDFDHNLVLPPHLGNPTQIGELSPYPCTSLQVCERFATSPERINILHGFLEFRKELYHIGLHQGFQWLDGSFMEDVETREKRPPNDMDIVTLYWGYDVAFQSDLLAQLPEFGDHNWAKTNYMLDHFAIDMSFHPLATTEYVRYWIQLFSHNRDQVWKGMLRVELNTPTEDAAALDYLQNVKLP